MCENTSTAGGDGAGAGMEEDEMNTSHLSALMTRLSNERQALARATKQGEIELRTVWVRQCEKEINSEEAFLGMGLTDWNEPEMSIDEIMAELDA